MSVIIPIFINNEEDRCPECDKIEDKVTICRHCNYKYDNDEWWVTVLGVAIIIFIIWLFFSIVFCLIEKITIWQMMQNQFNAFVGLFI